MRREDSRENIGGLMDCSEAEIDSLDAPLLQAIVASGEAGHAVERVGEHHARGMNYACLQVLGQTSQLDWLSKARQSAKARFRWL